MSEDIYAGRFQINFLHPKAVIKSTIFSYFCFMKLKKISPSENRTPVSRVTGACTGHYTKGDW
jgi:hypothetical protein